MRKATIQDVLDRNGIMVIDGSMSTALEALGANTKSTLWTAAAPRMRNTSDRSQR